MLAAGLPGKPTAVTFTHDSRMDPKQSASFCGLRHRCLSTEARRL